MRSPGALHVSCTAPPSCGGIGASLSGRTQPRVAPSLAPAPESARPSPARPPVEAPAPGASADSARKEIAQLGEVRSAFDGGDHALALSLADAGHRRFRGGLLYEQREAIAIRALAELGRTLDARKRGERYLTRFPSGPHAARVSKTIGER